MDNSSDMCAAYPEWDYKGRETIAATATKLYQARKTPSRLSPLIFMTDPKRVPDVVAAAKKLPRGTAIIYRHFGSAQKLEQAQALREITMERGQQILIGGDPDLAVEVGADGAHFRRDAYVLTPHMWRQLYPDWLITMAGIKTGYYHGDLTVLDGLLVSSIFPSQSPSAGEPIGVTRLSQIVKDLPVPIFALGGVNKETAPKLMGSGAAGIAGIGFGV